LENLGINIIWQTGKYFFEEAKKTVEGLPSDRVNLYDFINRMNLAYALADLIVSRAGASTVSELCMIGKPAMLVPLPTAAEDHQAMNAMSLVKENAAIMIRDQELNNLLFSEIKSLLSDQERMNQLSANIKKLALPDAASPIAREVLLLAKTHSGV